MATRGRKPAKRTTAPKRTRSIRKSKSVRPKSASKTARSKVGRLKPAPPKSGKRVSGKSKSETATLKSQLRIAQDRQTASAEILRTIGSVAGDAERSLYQIAETTKRLFEASSVSIFVAEGDRWGQVIHDGASSKRISAEVPVDQLRIGGHSLPGAAFGENRQIHLPDIDHVDPAIADWPGLRPARAAGARTISGTPLRRAGHAIGVLIVHRNRLAPFTAGELALLQTFADQAAIAIHNARLFNETQEALERQTATADILKVIASSPDDVQPVFDAIAESSNRLIGGYSTTVIRFDGDIAELAAFTPVGQEADAGLRALFPRPIAASDPQLEQVRRGRIEEIADTESEGAGEFIRNLARVRGWRSRLMVPLMNVGDAVGVISITRKEPGAFAKQDVELLRTFADQAVIALENARLFNETREALERQTATADILKVIASSPNDVQPVFDAIAESARRVIGGHSSLVTRVIGDQLHLAAFTTGSEAGREKLTSTYPQPFSSPIMSARVVRTGQVVFYADTERDADDMTREFARARGYRSVLAVPMLREGTAIGTINVTRVEPGEFDENTIGLLKTFADQAVIAIENARLFNETREALERQTAISDVLRVISSSPGDVGPVLASVAEHAARICEAEIVDILTIVDDKLQYAAEFGEFGRIQPGGTMPLNRDSVIGRSICDKQPVHVVDLQSMDHDFPLGREFALAHGHRTTLAVPLIREDCALGTILVRRAEVRPFDDRHVALLKTFADQAAIAIENARLINETREALERQTATADILKVIASSPDDVQPVFEAIAASANGLLGGFSTAVFRFVGDIAHLAAFTPTTPAADSVLQSSFPMPLADFEQFELAKTGQPVEITDIEQMPNKRIKQIARLRGFRSMLFVPLMGSEAPIGLISVTRTETGSFAGHHVQLLQTFADQAVIAIENVRLFDEVQAKTADLQESLQQQTATADVLKVISASPGKIEPVFDKILGSARQLCGAEFGHLLLFDGETWRAEALHNVPEAHARFWKTGSVVAGPETNLGRVQRSGKPDQVADVRVSSGYLARSPLAVATVELGGARTLLTVPLLKEGRVIGGIAFYRTEVRPFDGKQIELLSSFADQAVIAIENARLFEAEQARTSELTVSLQQQTATADVLKVISRSAFDLQAVFDTLVRSAAQLCEADYGIIFLRKDDTFYAHATSGARAEFLEFLKSNPRRLSDKSMVPRVARTGAVVHIPDRLLDPDFQFTGSSEALGRVARTMLGVPLLRNGAVEGVFVVSRYEPRPFTQRQIELVEGFSDQAVIAIENVRLFEEVQAKTADLQESLQQQTATADVLKVISASPGELEPVFQAMLENAVRLCEAKFAMLFFYEDGEFRAVGHWNVPPAYGEYLVKNSIRADPKIPLGRVVMTKQAVQVADLLLDQSYLERFAGIVNVVELGGARTLLQVPMLKENELVGTIGIYRQEVRPFTDKQIALVQNFAAQGVIAIQNAHLLSELRQRTDDLTESLDDLRTAQDRLIQTEKLASLGQLTAGIAHEIKNPLNFVNNFSALSAELIDEMTEVFENPALDEASRRKELDEIRELLKSNLEKVVQHGKRADSIVKNMLLHSREGSGERRPADINALLDESLNLAYHGARAEKSGFNITLQRDFDADAGEAELFPQEITRALLNLISNGFYAATKRKADNDDPGFESVLAAATRNLGDRVEIRIRDNGTGIPAEVKEKMFNPFFTTKPAGEGTGLGLSMSHDIIVKQHGGSIDVETEPGQFTELRIILPRRGRK
jgi:GAF domain-containing protein